MQLEKNHMQSLSRIAVADTVPAKVKKRAYILLYKAEGFSDDDISEMLKVNRITVRRWINRYECRKPEDKITQLLDVSKGRGRKDGFTDAEKDWIFSVIDSIPDIHGGESDLWDIKNLKKHIASHAKEAGHDRLSTISYYDLYSMVSLYRKRPWAHVEY